MSGLSEWADVLVAVPRFSDTPRLGRLLLECLGTGYSALGQGIGTVIKVRDETKIHTGSERVVFHLLCGPARGVGILFDIRFYHSVLHLSIYSSTSCNYSPSFYFLSPYFTMYKALAAFLCASASLLSLPVRAAPVSAAAAHGLATLDETCTFTLWHKQLHPFPAGPKRRKQNYIQINSLLDHANDMAIDIALLRGPVAFNSYSRVATSAVFAIEGLLDETNLVVAGEDGSDTLRFSSQGRSWTVDGERDAQPEAWCEVGDWDVAIDEGKFVGTRVCFLSFFLSLSRSFFFSLSLDAIRFVSIRFEQARLAFYLSILCVLAAYLLTS